MFNKIAKVVNSVINSAQANWENQRDQIADRDVAPTEEVVVTDRRRAVYSEDAPIGVLKEHMELNAAGLTAGDVLRTAYDSNLSAMLPASAPDALNGPGRAVLTAERLAEADARQRQPASAERLAERVALLELMSAQEGGMPDVQLKTEAVLAVLEPVPVGMLAVARGWTERVQASAAKDAAKLLWSTAAFAAASAMAPSAPFQYRGRLEDAAGGASLALEDAEQAEAALTASFAVLRGLITVARRHEALAAQTGGVGEDWAIVVARDAVGGMGLRGFAWKDALAGVLKQLEAELPAARERVAAWTKALAVPATELAQRMERAARTSAVIAAKQDAERSAAERFQAACAKDQKARRVLVEDASGDVRVHYATMARALEALEEMAEAAGWAETGRVEEDGCLTVKYTTPGGGFEAVSISY